MTELNEGKPRKIINAGPYSFNHEEDSEHFGAYETGGIITQVKQPKVLNFKRLKKALKELGEFLPSDFYKFGRLPLSHLVFQALNTFVSELQCLPVLGSEEDAQKLISITSNIKESFEDGKLKDTNPKLLQHFTFGVRAVLNPMAAIFDGIVGQEVMKACSGMSHPLFQLYIDSIESLSTEPLELIHLRPLNSCCHAQLSLFGTELQKKSKGAQVFVVGYDVLGCEFLKNLALMGISCNNQMVIPGLTRNCDVSRAPPKKQAPMCTVHSFPHNVDHCLTRSRSEFGGLPEKTLVEVKAYLSNSCFISLFPQLH